MTTIDLGDPIRANRAVLLRQATHAAHESLDTRIMQSAPFSDRARYGLFVQVQYLFHREIDSLYGDAALKALLPDLAERRRLGQIEQDLADLGLAAPAAAAEPAFRAGETVDVPTALGWLYVAEGSNLGAAFLLKEAAKLGLSETCGARHLAAHPQGRGLHWRTFTAALDTVSLSVDDEARAVAGAKEAFAYVRDTVERQLPLS